MIMAAVAVIYLFGLLQLIQGYKPCDDVVIYSFGHAFNTDFLGQYTQDKQQQTSSNRYSFTFKSSSNTEYKLWWAHFKGQISRWSIGLKVGDEGSVLAYKDSHALHPSEIARQRSFWRVYDHGSRKWIVDQSIHVKCSNVVSTFEWKDDCFVLGITNTGIDSSRQYGKLDSLDYMKKEGKGLTAEYHSLSTGNTIKHDGTQWNIYDQDMAVRALVTNDNGFINGMAKTNMKWILSNGNNAKYMSVHCEIPERDSYYKILRNKNQICSVTADGTPQNECMNTLNNPHFNTVIMKDFNEWEFGLTDDMQYFTWNETTNNDISHKIPSVGIGTAGIRNDRDVLLWSINKYNYKLIDSASDHAPWYQNEYIIGNLLKNGIFSRETFMVTTKLYAKDQGLNGAQHGLDDSLSALNVDYIDIYLIHHPHCDNNLCDGSWKTSWRIIEDYYYLNKIKYVGISNFDMNQFHELLDWTNIPISVIQNWFDPFRQNDKNMINEAYKLGIIYQAYSLLGTQWKYIGNGYRGNKDPVFTNNKLREISNKYNGKSIAQIVLRWALQNNIAILPSSSKEHRIKENMEIFDFQLNEEDMVIIDNLV